MGGGPVDSVRSGLELPGSLWTAISYNTGMTILPDVQTAIFDKLGTITEKLATLEERTQWSKTLVVGIFLALGGLLLGGLTWSGIQQYQLGSLSKSVESLVAAETKTNERLDKAVLAIEQQSKEISKLTAAIPLGHNVKETSYGAMPYSNQYTKTITQCGVFSPKTAVPGRKNAYRWPMLVKFDNWDVRHIGVGFEKPIPGTAISAQLVEGGRYCEMEIVTDNEAALATALQNGITGCVSITVPATPTDAASQSDGIRVQEPPGTPPVPHST